MTECSEKSRGNQFGKGKKSLLSHWNLKHICILSLEDLNSPLLFGRLNGLSSDSTIDILYQLGTTQDSGTKDRYVKQQIFNLNFVPISVFLPKNSK